MKTTIRHYFLAFGFWLLAFGLQAQDYQWQWAKSGGGNLNMQSETIGMSIPIRAEHIIDIVTDEDNNYYFLGTISHGNSHVDGNEVTTFGSTTAGRNIIITSFTCEGIYRWSRVIGGGGVSPGQHASNLVLDNNGGIYISIKVDNTTGTDFWGNILAPTCFGENNCLSYHNGNHQEVQEGFKNIFLLKYDTNNGDLLWRKDYQGNTINNWGIEQIFDLQIDSDDILHTIIGLGEGTHLDGAVTVELDENEKVKNYLVKFNSATGNLIGTPLLLPLEGVHNNNTTTFRYNKNLNRYYLAGFNFSESYYIVSFNGVTFEQGNSTYTYFLSFNPDNFDDWWYKEFTGIHGSQVNGIAIDNNSDIYIGGVTFVNQNSSTFFGDHLIGEHPVTTSYSGNRPFILKMNSQGDVQWSKTPSGYIDPVAQTGTYYAYDVAISGNEVALATHGRSTAWDNFSINRPSGHGNDPYLIRFNKQTGEVIGLHDIYGSSGNHLLTAVTTDQDGNYVVGGAMRNSLFTDNPNGITTLYNNGGSYTDFFMARLANSVCGESGVSTEVFEPQTLKLYPNPTSGLVYIEVQDLQSYEVYNLLGQRLLSGTSEVINLQDLSKGTYIVKVTTQSGEVMTSKVIKQ